VKETQSASKTSHSYQPLPKKMLQYRCTENMKKVLNYKTELLSDVVD
jgi:hypothetical protein